LALGARLNRLRKNSRRAPQSPSAAKADPEKKPFIAAVNRCATQNQGQHRVFRKLQRRALPVCGEDRIFPQPMEPCTIQNNLRDQLRNGLGAALSQPAIYLGNRRASRTRALRASIAYNSSLLE
jgi:hypothetical protein